MNKSQIGPYVTNPTNDTKLVCDGYEMCLDETCRYRKPYTKHNDIITRCTHSNHKDGLRRTCKPQCVVPPGFKCT